MNWRELETFAFGDDRTMADHLAALVLDGRKRATCWAAVDGIQTEIGKRTVMLDRLDRTRAVLETVQLFQCRFDQIDAAFAHDEGEDDRTLQSWKQAHRVYFCRRNQFAEDMLLWCERFDVIKHIAIGA